MGACAVSSPSWDADTYAGNDWGCDCDAARQPNRWKIRRNGKLGSSTPGGSGDFGDWFPWRGHNNEGRPFHTRLDNSCNPLGFRMFGACNWCWSVHRLFGGVFVAMLTLRLFKFPRFEISFLCSTGMDHFQLVCQTLEFESVNISNFTSRSTGEGQICVRFELYLGWQKRCLGTADILRRLSDIPGVSGIEINTL